MTIKELFNDYVQDLQTYIMFRIKQMASDLKPQLDKINRTPIFLSMGAPTQNPPEFVINKLKEALTIEGIHTYSSPKGEKYFLDAVKTRMKNRFGVELDSNKQIFSLIGSKEGIANIIRELINPKNEEKERDIILVPDPGYASYKEMVKVSGGVGYSLPLTKDNNYMPDLEEIINKLKSDGYDEKKIKALIVNYPNNPLGVGATREYLQNVVDFCKKRNILLISDAAYCDMYFDEKDKPISILELEGAMDIAVEFHSFSKPFAMTGWRIGWVCGNEEACSMFGKLKSTIDTGIFKGIQYAASQVLNSNEGEKYIIKANEDFKIKQEIALNGFKELGWDFSQVNIPNATFYLWLPIPKRYKTSWDFTCDVLKTSGVVLVPGHAFGDYGEGFFRISIVCSEEKLKEVFKRLKDDGFYYNK